MTKQEYLELYIQMRHILEVLEEAARMLENEPFCTVEPDNESFCKALRSRIATFQDATAIAADKLL